MSDVKVVDGGYSFLSDYFAGELSFSNAARFFRQLRADFSDHIYDLFGV